MFHNTPYSLNFIEFQCSTIGIIDTGPTQNGESCYYDNYIILECVRLIGTLWLVIWQPNV